MASLCKGRRAVVRMNVHGGIGHLTLADPVSGNALGEEMVRALTSALDRCGRDTEIKVVVMTALGDTFSAGAPVEFLTRLADGDLRSSDILLPRALLECPVPVIAAMAGAAVGGGFALGLAADIICIARESRYGFSFMNMGFTPGMGTTALCTHVLSPAVAHELLYSGEMRRGADLQSAGINYVLPRADLEPRAFDVAERIAEKPRTAVEALKRTLSLPRRRAFDESLTLETLMHQVTLGAPGAAARIRATYVE